MAEKGTFGDYFNSFDPIDEDAPGGYARVAEAEALFLPDGPARVAFKVMREKDYAGKRLAPNTWEKRFLEEFRILHTFTVRPDTPPVFTKLLGSGYIRRDVLDYFERYRVPYDLPLYFTGLEEADFADTHAHLEKETPGRYLPFLAVELAPYGDSLFRQIRRRDWRGRPRPPQVTPRLPVGEVIRMSWQLLEALKWFHDTFDRIYLDWKTEQVYWSAWRLGVDEEVKTSQACLIDYNVTSPLARNPRGDDESPRYRPANLREELRLFCGAVLYPALTLTDPENEGRELSSKPTRRTSRGSRDVRLRYRVEGALRFYGAGERLDAPLKKILRTGLEAGKGYASVEALQEDLRRYARDYLDYDPARDFAPLGRSGEAYQQALRDLRFGQNRLLRARRGLVEALRYSSGESGEYEALVHAIDYALKHFFLP